VASKQSIAAKARPRMRGACSFLPFPPQLLRIFVVQKRMLSAFFFFLCSYRRFAFTFPPPLSPSGSFLPNLPIKSFLRRRPATLDLFSTFLYTIHHRPSHLTIVHPRTVKLTGALFRTSDNRFPQDVLAAFQTTQNVPLPSLFFPLFHNHPLLVEEDRSSFFRVF